MNIPASALQAARRKRCNRSSVRFTMTRRGTPRMIDYRRKRRYRELLEETPHWNAPLSCKQDDDGDWIIVARLDPELTHGRHSLQENILAEGQCWDSEEEAQRHLDEHEDQLRLELTEDLFTMGLCTRCEDVVPVFGDYVAYAPAGELVCGPCLTDDDDDPAGPAILHP